jgi:membrane protein implicated in regulation of membrane protease activity
MNPLLWLAGIVVPVSLVLIPFTDGEWRWFFAILVAVMIAATLIAYFWFMCRDRDRLQSEDYQLERHRMALLGDDFLGSAKSAIILDQSPSRNPRAPTDAETADE